MNGISRTRAEPWTWSRLSDSARKFALRTRCICSAAEPRFYGNHAFPALARKYPKVLFAISLCESAVYSRYVWESDQIIGLDDMMTAIRRAALELRGADITTMVISGNADISLFGPHDRCIKKGRSPKISGNQPFSAFSTVIAGQSLSE